MRIIRNKPVREELSVAPDFVEVRLPIKTVSEANLREHWGARARRTAYQREAAFLVGKGSLDGFCFDRCAILLTRIAPRFLDSDNLTLTRALKAVRDGLADALGVDDGDPRLDWSYAKKKGVPREYAVLAHFASIP